MKKIVVLITSIIFFVITGCGSYYKILDPTTDKIYYADDLDRKKDGSVEFVDALTGSEVRIENSEVTEINKEEFKANTKKE